MIASGLAHERVRCLLYCPLDDLSSFTKKAEVIRNSENEAAQRDRIPKRICTAYALTPGGDQFPHTPTASG